LAFERKAFGISVENPSLFGIIPEMSPRFSEMKKVRVNDRENEPYEGYVAMFNLEKLDTHPTLWGRTHEERWGAVDNVAQKLNDQLGKTALMTGAQFALRHIDESQKQPKAKCPFTPQREMIAKLWGA